MLAFFFFNILPSGLLKTWFKQRNLDARPIDTIVALLSQYLYIFLASKSYAMSSFLNYTKKFFFYVLDPVE